MANKTNTSYKINNINGMKILTFDAKAFIIPNTPCAVNGWLSESTREERFQFGTKVLQANGFTEELDRDNDLFIQLWFHNDITENIRDHGMAIIDEDGEESYIQPAIEYLPAKIFADKKEGDTFKILIPVSRYNRKKDEREDILLAVDLTLDQLNYRYRSWGGFDELFGQMFPGIVQKQEEFVEA